MRLFLLLTVQAYWTEYIHLANIRQIQREAADAWLRTCLRYVSMSKHASTLSKATKTTNPAGKFLDSIQFVVFMFTTSV